MVQFPAVKMRGLVIVWRIVSKSRRHERLAKPLRRLHESSVGMCEAFEKVSRRLLGLFSKPSAPATSSRNAREDATNPPSRRRHGEPIARMLHEGTVRASRSLREDFAKTLRQGGFNRASRLLREGFAEHPRRLSGKPPSRWHRDVFVASSLRRGFMNPSFEAFVDPSDGFHDKPGTPSNREGQYAPSEARIVGEPRM